MRPKPSQINRTLACLAYAAIAGFAIVQTASWWVAPSRAAPLAIHIHSEHAMFQLLISPGTVGSDGFVLQLMSGDGSTLRAREATLYLSLPERGIEPKAHKTSLGADGYWHARDVPIAQPGRWHVRVDVVTDREKISLEDDFDIPPSRAGQ